MTLWNPTWSVLIDGVEYNDVTLANLTIQSGRTDIYSQAVAGYLNINLIELNGETFEAGINSSITVFVNDGSAVPIFGGSITDIITTVDSAGTGGITQSISIVALGALSRLPKVLTTGVLSQDLDGLQIYEVLEGILYGAWNEVPAATTWASYNPATTWANAQNSGLGEIDEGNYELTSRSADVTDAYSLVAALATSGLGYLYEDASGRISYADSTHRGIYLSTNGYVDLSANDAFSNGLQTAIRAGDVRNKITLTYKNGQQVSATDATSIQTYGALAQNIQTSLEHGADATSQANFYLALRSYPRANFNQITFPLESTELSDSDREALLNVFMGMPVNISDLPTNMGSSFQGFVEGWQFSAGYNTLALSLYLTPVAYSLQAFRWNNVPSVERWNTIEPTLDWLNATIVA